MRLNEIVCMCEAYDHPHRLGGGKCDGSAWCEAFRSIDSYECQNCILNNNDECEVVSGQENIKYATCVNEELRTRYITDEYGYLPLDIEDYWEKKHNEYHDHEEEFVIKLYEAENE